MHSGEALDTIFRNELQQWSVRQGTVRSPTGTRQVWLSADIIQGMHSALEYEAGDAWRIILKTCGQKWGRLVVKHLAGELASSHGSRVEDLTVEEYVSWVQGWFREAGWGELSVNLSEVQSHGLLHLSVARSPIPEMLKDPTGRVDVLLEGVLGEIFSAIAGQELGCVELSCVAGGHPECTFVVSGVDRIATAEEALEDGRDPSVILAELRR